MLLLRAFVATRGRGSLRADFGLTVRAADWPWLAAGVLLQGVALGMVAVIEAVAGSEPKQEVVRAIQHSPTATKVLGALAVVVFAPVAEELLFRGLLLRGLLRRFAAPAAVLIGGLTFAVVHLLDPAAAPLLAPLALVGVLAGILAVRTRRPVALDPAPRRVQPAERDPDPHHLIRPRSALTCTDAPLIPRIIPAHPLIILQEIRPNRRHLNHTRDTGRPGPRPRGDADAVQPMRQAGNGRDPDEDRR